MLAFLICLSKKIRVLKFTVRYVEFQIEIPRNSRDLICYMKVVEKYFSIIWSSYQTIWSNTEAITELNGFLSQCLFYTNNQ